eukprot:scaffold188291_cov23-Tisochrysis_lutea.AAC.1
MVPQQVLARALEARRSRTQANLGCSCFQKGLLLNPGDLSLGSGVLSPVSKGSFPICPAARLCPHAKLDVPAQPARVAHPLGQLPLEWRCRTGSDFEWTTRHP